MITKNNLILAMVLALGIQFNTVQSADLVGSGFSYQGELLDNGSPANTEYDLMFVAYDSLTDGNTVSVLTPEFLNVLVTNGLFNLENIDFGDTTYEGKEVFLEVSVRKSADGGDYTALEPRQRIGATPYSVQSEYSIQAEAALSADSATQADSALIADELAAGSAVSGDVLQFGATGWGPVSADSLGSGLWNENNGNVYYSSGNVGIGILSPQTPLHVDSNGAAELSRFDGGNQMYNSYFENGTSRGYVGSFQDGGYVGTSNADFEIGTTVLNTNGKMHLTTKATPRLSIDENGNVGVGNTEPTARLDVKGHQFLDPINVRVDDSIKLSVKKDGSTTTYGTLNTEGTLVAKNHTQQNINSNGMLKYMVVLQCDTNVSQIVRSYNGTTTIGSVSSTHVSANHCRINFPTNIDQRYWVASANTSLGGINASCDIFDNDSLTCNIGFMNNGNNSSISGDMTILVY